DTSPDLYQSVKMFSAFSIGFNVFVYLNTIGLYTIMMFMIRNGLLQTSDAAPQGTLERQAIIKYDADLFKDDEECCICMGEFDDKDEIRRSRELALHHADFHARATAAATLGAEEGFRSAARDFIAGLAAVITSQAEQREAGQQQQQHWSNSGQCVTTYPGSKPGAAVQVAPGQLKRQQHERSFLKQLRELLQGLPPAQRRDFIAQRLSQAQRVSLEQWILAERAGPMQGASKQGRPFKTGIHCPGLSQRSLCCWRGKRGRVGYRPIMHLFGSFYAQAAFTFDLSSAVAALGTLLTMRTLCQALGGTCTQKQGGDQEVVATLRAAVHDALAMKRPGPIGHRFYFKTRMRMAHGYEISTPSRSDVDTALGEWLHLLRTKAGGARAPK
ncbi:unnamed protein product, partial [Polarella glacialis]